MADTPRNIVRPSSTAGAADPRLELVLRIERTVLAGRYIAVALVVGLLLLTDTARASHIGAPGVLIVCAYLLAHNGFVHYALLSRRSLLFFSSANFLLYLGEISLLVAIAGASESPLFALYLIFIIAFNTYSRATGGAFVATLLCCFCYGLIVYAEWNFTHVKVSPATAAAKFLALVMCGWLAGSLNDFLKHTEAALEQRASALASSEATLRMILDSADDPILMHDESELVAEVNERACAFLRLPRERIVGSRIREFLFDDGNLGTHMALLRSRGEYHGEAIVIRSDGEECNVEQHVHSFLQEDARYYVSIWHDITEMKRLEEASRLAHIQLDQVNLELYRVNQLKKAFYANISRRLHSPLSAILGFLDMLLGEELGPLSAEQRQAMQSCRRSAARIRALVDEVFTLDTPPEAPAQEPAESRERPGSEGPAV